MGEKRDCALDVASRFVDLIWTSPALPRPVVLAVIAGSPRESETDRLPLTLMSTAKCAPSELIVSAEIVALSMTRFPLRIRTVPAALAETFRKEPWDRVI